MARVPSKPLSRSRKDTRTPGKLRDVLRENVKQQQRRSAVTASPPEARRPVRERVRTAHARSRGKSQP